ncbi:type VI secretion system tip protein VgrG, partial [Mesorhizobium sp. M4B.F.Ca.ET.088.02.2.1]
MPNERATVVQTPLGAELLTFTHLVGRDEISRCFAHTIGFVSTNHDVDPLKMLGGSVSIEGESDPKRWFSGLVSEFRLTRIEDRLAYYEAVIRPWLWFLGNTTDCRIFQNMTAVEIIEKIFSKYGIAKFEKRLQGSYPQREYCVQYDESDLDFVQRLMEHEGIFYFFEYDEGKHTLILCDAMSKLKPAPGYDKVLYNFEGQASRRDVEYITEWIPGSSVRPGAYAHTDYDFEKPGADLMAKSAQPFGHKEAAGENYRQPGAHLDVGRGDKIAGIRREELQAVHQRGTAVGTVRGLFAGCKFKLESFPRDDQNQDYMVLSAEYRLFDPGYRTQNEGHSENFRIVLG